MTTYLIPTDEDTVELVARAIARNRMHNDASEAMEQIIGVPLDASQRLESSFDKIFEGLWDGTSPVDDQQRATYRSDALAAIRALNLKLITTSE